MVQVTESLSRKLTNMSFICAILVVTVHVQRPLDSPFISRWISDGISDIAVPFFFIVSGFFLAGHFDRPGWWRAAVIKRVRTLLIPFLCLNLLWFPVLYGCHYVGVWFFHADHSNPLMTLSWTNFLIMLSPIPLVPSPALGPTWYIRALFWLVVLSPLFTWIVRRSKSLACFFVIMVFCVWMIQLRMGFVGGNSFNLRCVFYFVLGAVLRLWGMPFRNDVLIPKLAGMFLLSIGFLLFVLYRMRWIDEMALPISHSLGILLMIGGVWAVVPDARWPSFFAGNAFPVYVLHSILISLVGFVYKSLGLEYFFRSSMMFAICTIIYTLAACWIASTLKMRCPKFAAVIFGGRCAPLTGKLV